MFDPVTNEALRIRRIGTPLLTPLEEPARRTSLICNVCTREIRPEEQVFWVGAEVHCFQCHDMLKYEYDKERQVDSKVRKNGTRWHNGTKD